MNLPQSRTIGTFYLIFAILSGLIGVVLSLVIRFDLSSPDMVARLLPSFLFPLISSSHAVMMVVFTMVPALFGGFANWLIPMMIGTDDMQFKRLNFVAFLLLVSGFLMLMGALFVPASPFGMRLLLLSGVHSVALSFLFSAINFVATIVAARAPFMRLRDMPPFIWSIWVASFLMVASLPIMTVALTVKFGGMTLEGNSSLLPVMMWFFTHPELFILLLPAFGIISEVIATFCGGRLVMDKMVKAAFVAMGGIGFVLWGQTILTYGLTSGQMSGLNSSYRNYFFLSILALALPVAGVIVSWLATMGRAVWRRQAFLEQLSRKVGAGFRTKNCGKNQEQLSRKEGTGSETKNCGKNQRIEHFTKPSEGKNALRQVPMLWALGFISMILVASLSAFSLYFSKPFTISAFISHFHYILGLSGVFAIFAGWYFWFGKVSGYQIRALSGKLHFWTMFIAVHLTFLPQHFGAQTHAPDSWWGVIEAAFGWQRLASLGAGFSALSLLLFFYAITEAFVRKRPAAANPWGQGARGLEWQFTSPPRIQNNIVLPPARNLS